MVEQLQIIQAMADGSLELLWIYPSIWALIIVRKIIM